MNPALFVATLGGIGRLKPAPGTWGSLVVLPLLVFGPVIALLLGLLVTLLGFVATREVLRDAPDEDPGWIVVDEAADAVAAEAGAGAACHAAANQHPLLSAVRQTCCRLLMQQQQRRQQQPQQCCC